MAKKECPKCGSENIIYQREQSGNVGASTVVKPKKKGCFHWLIGGWAVSLLYWVLIGWWKNLLFGKRERGDKSVHIGKTMNRTVAVCQDCGHTWKV